MSKGIRVLDVNVVVDPYLQGSALNTNKTKNKEAEDNEAISAWENCLTRFFFFLKCIMMAYAVITVKLKSSVWT